MSNYQVIKDGNSLAKLWVKNVPVDENAIKQIMNIANMPFIHKHVAVMPDCHVGKGACVGTVIPTTKAIIPAAVGVDLGCGMDAVKTSLKASDLPESLRHIRNKIERNVPHGRTHRGGRNDRGSWHNVPKSASLAWDALDKKYSSITSKYQVLGRGKTAEHLGTLGGGNHFIEICLDTEGSVWFMLHSGSRGVGNRIGRYFIDRAKKEMERWHIDLPDKDLAYLPYGITLFNDYVGAVGWAQEFARVNRKLMMESVISAVRQAKGVPAFDVIDKAISCHHNYIEKENHFGKNVWVTRKGAVRARKGDLGIIPGSMGSRSYIVKGKGDKNSFTSCSHGAGRVMSRKEAKRRFSLADHVKDTDGVECKKDSSVLDETPKAYKNIDDVMAAQSDLVDVIAELKQIVCIKG